MEKKYLSSKNSYFEKVLPIVVTYNPSMIRLEVLFNSLSLFKAVQLVDNIDELKNCIPNIKPCFFPYQVQSIYKLNKNGSGSFYY